MHVLVTWGTKGHGTTGIAHMIARELRGEGHDVTTIAAPHVDGISDFDAVVIGGGLYGNRWQRDARRFVARHVDDLRRVPVWFFSSGPLDDSAERETIPPTRHVMALMDRVGACGHMTFGGRLSADAQGFPARAMARENAGDWRNEEQIRSWARYLAGELPTAGPGVPTGEAARSLARVFSHGIVGWAACAAIMGALLAWVSTSSALVVHAIAVPLVFLGVSWHYFARSGAREPMEVAIAFTGIVALLDLVVVAGWIQGSMAMFSSVLGVWLPFALIFATTYFTGLLMSTLPWPKGKPKTPPAKAAPSIPAET